MASVAKRIKPTANGKVPPANTTAANGSAPANNASQFNKQTTKKRAAPETRRILLQPPESNVLRILIATDCHLGYLENDPLRRDDSFNSFEEILQHALLNDVDFVLLGGDLFHDNKPSRATLYRTTEILSKYVLGDREVHFNITSNHQINFPTNGHPNFLDPNINIQLPIFTIHGNHDDPAGIQRLSTLDLLHQDLLLNYFGKQDKLDAINVEPLIIQKGETTAFVYGIGAIRDERLYVAFESKQVRWAQVEQQRENATFQLAVVHQNRTPHTLHSKTYLPEKELPGWLNFIVWGHEHDCHTSPEDNAEKEFQVLQPGSSVATSLAEGESRAKHCAILEIRRNEHRMYPVPLYTVRPFEHAEFKLADELNAEDANEDVVEELLKAQVDKMLERIHNNPFYQNPDRPMPPLVRLRVDYSGGFKRISTSRFGQQYADKIANSDEILMWTKPREYKSALTGDGPNTVKSEDKAHLAEMLVAAADQTPPIYELVNEIITTISPLSLLSQYKFADAVREYVDKKEVQSIPSFLDTQLASLRRQMKRDTALMDSDLETVSDEAVATLAKKYHMLALEQDKKEAEANGTLARRYDFQLENLDLNTLQQEAKNATEDGDDDGDVFGSDDDAMSDDEGGGRRASPAKRGRGGARGGRGRGRGRGGATTSSRARKKKTADDSDADSDSSATPVKAERGIKNESPDSSASSKPASGRRLPASLAGGRSTAGASQRANGTSQRSMNSFTAQGPKRARMGQLAVTNDSDVIAID